MTIRHVIAAAACALGLAACSSSNADLWVPSWTAFGVKPTTVSVTIESEPAGAEARTTQGLTCLTPCTLSVPPTEEFSISYTLAGYVPQSVSVRPVETEPSKFGPPPVPGLTPNPVMAQLKPVADVAVPAQRKKKQRPAATATAAPAAPRVSRAATAPPAAPPNASPTATIAPRAPAAAAAPPAAPPAAPSSNAAPTASAAVAAPAVTPDPGAAPPVYSAQGSLGPPAGMFTPIPGTIR